MAERHRRSRYLTISILHVITIICQESQAQNKWKALVKKFKSEHSRVQLHRSGDGLEDSYESNWPYYESLSFLASSVLPNPSTGNLDSVVDVKPSITSIEIEESECKEVGQEMNKKQTDIAEEILRMHSEKYALLEKSLTNNVRVSSSAEQDKHNMAFFETLLPTLREVSKEDILLCRNDVSRVIFNYAYKNATWKSITDGTVQGSSVASSTPAPPKRKRQIMNEDDDCQIVSAYTPRPYFQPTSSIKMEKKYKPTEREREIERNIALSEAPMFAEPIPNVTVAVGRDANLPCVINNLGSYKVAWLHVGRQMLLTIHTHVVVKIPRFSVAHDKQKTWLLVIKSVEQQDRGYYMCQVNTKPMISQVGFLQVVVPPNILDAMSTESSVAVREHQNITLTCKAEGYPQPKLMWRREDGQAITVDRHTKVEKYDGEQLNLTRITRVEMGAYLCIATNGIPPTVSKRITVDVDFSPLIFVPNQLVGAPEGTNVTIDCHTEAHPRAISYWNFNKTMVLSNDKYTTEIKENSYRTHMRLTIRNLQTADFGSYQCISKNSLGETEGSIRLYAMPKPSAPPRATEIKSSANKEGRQHTTTPPPKRRTTMWPAAYNPYNPKRTEKPPPSEKKVERPEQKPMGDSQGSAYIIRWSAPQLMVVAVQYILTGPYMPPYVPQNAN